MGMWRIGLVFGLLQGLGACRGPDSAETTDKTPGDDGTGPGDEGSGDSGSGTGGPTGCFSEDPVLSVGTGEREFSAISNGDPITMVHGPQGGWHMLGSAQTTHMTDIITVHFTITHDRSGVVISDNTYRVATVYDEATCTGYYPGMYGYLYVEELVDGENDTPPELLSYETVTFCMDAEDQEGRTASDCRQVVAEPDPTDITPAE